MSFVSTYSYYSKNMYRFNKIHVNFGYTHDSYFSKWI